MSPRSRPFLLINKGPDQPNHHCLVIVGPPQGSHHNSQGKASATKMNITINQRAIFQRENYKLYVVNACISSGCDVLA